MEFAVAPSAVRVDRTGLKRLMRARGWNPRTLATIAEVPGRAVFRAMYHDGEATPSVVQRLAEALGAPPDALILKENHL